MTHNPKHSKERERDDAKVWMFLEEFVYCYSLQELVCMQFFIVGNISNSGTGLSSTIGQYRAGILEVSEVPEGHVKDAFHSLKLEISLSNRKNVCLVYFFKCSLLILEICMFLKNCY